MISKKPESKRGKGNDRNHIKITKNNAHAITTFSISKMITYCFLFSEF